MAPPATLADPALREKATPQAQLGWAKHGRMVACLQKVECCPVQSWAGGSQGAHHPTLTLLPCSPLPAKLPFPSPRAIRAVLTSPDCPT
jgi:hypothetical protein